MYCVTPFTFATCPFTSKGPSLQWMQVSCNKSLKLPEEKRTRQSPTLSLTPCFFGGRGRGKGKVSGWHFQKVLWLKYSNDLETLSKGNGWYWKREHKISFFFFFRTNNSFPTIYQGFLLCSFNLFWGEILLILRGPWSWSLFSSC